MSKLRLLFFPFSFLYKRITNLRNFLYEKEVLHAQTIPVKSIVIGNLSVGGTGKSPVTMYLANLFSSQLHIAILSRGYGRKTTGFIDVNENADAKEVGDEPLMFKKTFRNHVSVAVCEKRSEGVGQLLLNHPETELILLDDAFQHRQIKAGFHLLLTTFHDPFFTDFILPAGNLRESRKGANRADIILITKSPDVIDQSTKERYFNALEKYNKPVFFSRINYSELVPFTPGVSEIKHVLLVTGIAQPVDIHTYLQTKYKVDHIQFPDHHQFTPDDIDKIHRKFDTFASSEKAIVTTYKDYMRLCGNISLWGIDQFPWYFLPISVSIENENEFIKLIQNYVGKN